MLDLSDCIGLQESTRGTESLADLISTIRVAPIQLCAPGNETEGGKGSDKNGDKSLFAENKRAAWDKAEAARCNFDYRLAIKRRSDVNFITIWKKSVTGRTLVEIKSDENEIEHFASSMAPVIEETVGKNLRMGDWCICTSPKRRHREHNFASLISARISAILKIPFYEDVAFCHSRHRMNAVFTLNILPKETNVIVFDDFVTTGQTLCSMKKLLAPLGKNLVFFAGVNNKID